MLRPALRAVLRIRSLRRAARATAPPIGAASYAIAGPPGGGDVCLNGAAARLVSPGDRVIIISYADYKDAELHRHAPRVVHVDSANTAVEEATASALASLDSSAPRRYVEVDAACR